MKENIQNKIKKVLDKNGIAIEVIEKNIINCYGLPNEEIKYPFDINGIEFSDYWNETNYDNVEYRFNVYVDNELEHHSLTEDELNKFIGNLLLCELL